MVIRQPCKSVQSIHYSVIVLLCHLLCCKVGCYDGMQSSLIAVMYEHCHRLSLVAVLAYHVLLHTEVINEQDCCQVSIDALPALALLPLAVDVSNALSGYCSGLASVPCVIQHFLQSLCHCTLTASGIAEDEQMRLAR